MIRIAVKGFFAIDSAVAVGYNFCKDTADRYRKGFGSCRVYAKS